jgi:methionine-R-sulfoxide reductase
MWHSYQKPDTETLKQTLDPLTYEVTQQEATERPHSSDLNHNDAPGIYVDALSGAPLFSSADKYDSGSGWPSFTKPIMSDMIEERTDIRLHVPRTEVRTKVSDSHLGHVFNDGPQNAGGMRYCINGAALVFIPKEEMKARGYGDFLSKV